jgi:hypothetical protein
LGPLGIVQVPFSYDGVVAAAYLDAAGVELDAREVDLDDRALRLTAVVDVDVG